MAAGESRSHIRTHELVLNGCFSPPIAIAIAIALHKNIHIGNLCKVTTTCHPCGKLPVKVLITCLI